MLHRPPESKGCQKLPNNVRITYELPVEKLLPCTGKSEVGEIFQYWLVLLCHKDSRVEWKGIVRAHFSGNWQL
jgi:hypothetical protein